MLKETVKLTKEMVKALEATLSIPEYKDNVDEIMAVQKSPTKFWVGNSHLLNELSPEMLYDAITKGYEVI